MLATGTSTQRAARAQLALPQRLAWLAAFLAVMALAIYEVSDHGLGPAPIVAFLIIPDLAMAFGIGVSHQPGQLPARAVPAYNLVHQPILPIALIAIAALVPLDLFWFVGGLAWFAHIAIDGVVGYGQRTPDGWQRG